MESGDGGWIRAEAAHWDEDYGLGEDGRLGEDDSWAAAVAGPSAGKRWGHGGIPGFSGWVAAALAVVAPGNPGMGAHRNELQSHQQHQ